MEQFDTFGQLIRKFRQERRETLAELAENVAPLLPEQGSKISVAMLSRIETDDRLPSPKVAAALAEYFGIPAEDAIALVAIAKTSRSWPSPGAPRPDAATDSTITHTLAAEPDAGRHDRDRHSGSGSLGRSGRQAMRDAATKVRTTASIAPAASRVFANDYPAPEASMSDYSAKDSRSSQRELNDMIQVVDIAIRQLERTAPGATLTPPQRARFESHASELALRLSRLFG